ncbi:MAG: ECF-type sigma factor [Xanthomonadales bacterium]|jgi:RNA polymerase sigma factor (TIGR02999 family)|nr:ECF-type sigma factor [Xanthomonadales bacterium]
MSPRAPASHTTGRWSGWPQLFKAWALAFAPRQTLAAAVRPPYPAPSQSGWRMGSATEDFGKLLSAFRSGDERASAQLITLVYADLRRLAQAQLGPGGAGRTLSATALVNECYLRLSASASRNVESRNHFLNLASRVMRQVLCDYARERLAAKRGGGAAHDTLSALDRELHAEAQGLIELDELLGQLEQQHPRWARVFECRYFAGLSEQETADAVGVSLRTAQREWNESREWLAARATP